MKNRLAVLALALAFPLVACDTGEEEDAGIAEEQFDVEPTDQPAGPELAAMLTVQQDPNLGAYLTDAENRAVYMFEEDSENESNCYDACAQAWPPLTVPGGTAGQQPGATGQPGTTGQQPAAGQQPADVEQPGAPGQQPGTQPALTGDQIRPELISTIQRRDGSTQLTYNGHPLYHFAQDQGAGDTMGHDIEGHGGEWYLLTPEGEKLENANQTTGR